MAGSAFAFENGAPAHQLPFRCVGIREPVLATPGEKKKDGSEQEGRTAAARHGAKSSVFSVTVARMADPRDRIAESVPGKYYVDTQCIDCDVCRVTAPGNFQREEDRGYSYVFRQPETADEEAQCQEAMDSCPVEAIGDNGADPRP